MIYCLAFNLLPCLKTFWNVKHLFVFKCQWTILYYQHHLVPYNVLFRRILCVILPVVDNISSQRLGQWSVTWTQGAINDAIIFGTLLWDPQTVRLYTGLWEAFRTSVSIFFTVILDVSLSHSTVINPISCLSLLRKHNLVEKRGQISIIPNDIAKCRYFAMCRVKWATYQLNKQSKLLFQWKKMIFRFLILYWSFQMKFFLHFSFFSLSASGFFRNTSAKASQVEFFTE